MIADAAAFRLLVRRPYLPVPPLARDEPLHVCELVFDPDEDLTAPASELSSFGRSVASARVHRDANGMKEQLERAHELVDIGAVVVASMTEPELRLCHVIAHEAKQHTPVGIASSASATIAISRFRAWPVVTADPDVLTLLMKVGSRAIELR